MAKSWYVTLNGRQLGPLPSEQIQRMAMRGQILPETPLRPDSQDEFLPASTWPQLFAAQEATPQPLAARTPPRARPLAKAPVEVPKGKVVPRGVAIADASASDKTPRVVASPTDTPSPPLQPPPPPEQNPAGNFPAIVVADAGPSTRRKAVTRPAEDNQEPTARPHRSSRTPVLLLGGAAVVIAVVGGLLATFNPFNSPATPAAKQIKDVKLEIPAGPEVDPIPMPTIPVVAANAEKEPAPPALSSQSEALQSKVKNWREGSSTLKIGPLRYQLTGVWQTHSEEGDKEKPQLYIQIALTNVGTSPFTYLGWNGLSANKAAAVLLDEKGETLAVAPASVASDERLKSSVIAPRETLLDTLVFAAPATPSAQLRLVLPQIAISGLGSGAMGLEIPAAMVASERPATRNEPALSQGLAQPDKPLRQEMEEERMKRLLKQSLEEVGTPPTPKPNESPSEKKSDGEKFRPDAASTKQ